MTMFAGDAGSLKICPHKILNREGKYNITGEMPGPHHLSQMNKTATPCAWCQALRAKYHVYGTLAKSCDLNVIMSKCHISPSGKAVCRITGQ